ncbi:MAG: DUF2510 domain-containing protein [Acidimicrobiia bacterium]
MNMAVGRPGPKLWLSILTIVLGIVVGVASIVILVVNVSRDILGPTYAVPSTISLHLGTGTHVILERTGTQNSFDAGSRNVDLDPSQIDVLGPGGERVPVTYTSGTETITRPNGTYVSAVEFRVRRSGNYRVGIQASRPGLVMVQQSIGEVARRSVVWALGIGLGALLVFVGLIMLIVGIVRRSKAKQLAMAATYGSTPGLPQAYTASTVAVPMTPPTTAPVAGTPPTSPPASPPAWHPDPHGQHRLRYWDGSAWTDHTWD